MTETYGMKVVCKNCDYDGEAQIPNGVLVKDHKCPKCKTKSLEKKNEMPFAVA